jgi:hypothetical protein
MVFGIGSRNCLLNFEPHLLWAGVWILFHSPFLGLKHSVVSLFTDYSLGDVIPLDDFGFCWHFVHRIGSVHGLNAAPDKQGQAFKPWFWIGCGFGNRSEPMTTHPEIRRVSGQRVALAIAARACKTAMASSVSPLTMSRTWEHWVNLLNASKSSGAAAISRALEAACGSVNGSQAMIATPTS